MSECKLMNGSISTLVQEDLRQDGSESWVKNWPDECSLEVGTIIRIPYDEEVIDRLEQEKEQRPRAAVLKTGKKNKTFVKNLHFHK